MESIRQWMMNETGLTWMGKTLVSLFVVLGVLLLTRGITALVRRFVLKKKGGIQNQKTHTVITVLTNLITVVIAFWGLMYVLELFGINTKSILATAGIGGIAIGFGAQSLVKDIITGAFLLMGDQFVLGDYIKAGGAEGYVVGMNLRTTTVKAFSGEITHIPNGAITTVTNSSREPMRALAEIPVPYDMDPARVIDALNKALAALAEDQADVYTRKPEVIGVTGYTDFHYKLTATGYTKPMQQWAAERSFRSTADRVLKQIRAEDEKRHGTTTVL